MDQDLLLTLVLGFSLLLLLQTAVSAMRGWMLIVLGASLKVQARANLFSHLLCLPTSYFEARYMGDVMSRFGSQETILQAMTTEMVVAVLDGVMCCTTLALMVIFAPALTAIVLAGALLYAVLRWASYTPLRQASMEAIAWGARRDSHFLETLRGIAMIKMFNGHGERRARWLNLLVEAVNRQLTVQRLDLMFRTANALLLGTIGHPEHDWAKHQHSDQLDHRAHLIAQHPDRQRCRQDLRHRIGQSGPRSRHTGSTTVGRLILKKAKGALQKRRAPQ